METVQMTFTFKEGTKPAEMATKLRWHAGLLEGLAPKVAASVKNTAPAVDETEVGTTSDDEDFAPKKKSAAQRVAAAFDAEESEEAADEDFTTPAPAAKKAKKLTIDDVNDACMARSRQIGGKEGRIEVLAILKKKFKTTSVTDLEPEQYADVIKVMKV
jgi:hypothetical protein